MHTYIPFESKEFPGVAVAVLDLSYASKFSIEGSKHYWVVSTIVDVPGTTEELEGGMMDFQADSYEAAIEKAWSHIKKLLILAGLSQ